MAKKKAMVKKSLKKGKVAKKKKVETPKEIIAKKQRIAKTKAEYFQRNKRYFNAYQNEYRMNKRELARLQFVEEFNQNYEKDYAPKKEKNPHSR